MRIHNRKWNIWGRRITLLLLLCGLLLPIIPQTDAASVTYDPAALKAIKKLEELGFKNVPVCLAKNQYSLSDDPKLLGRPEGFNINIRDAYINAGAGFLVAITGTIIQMPGLPKVPAAEAIDVIDGDITGLF